MKEILLTHKAELKFLRQEVERCHNAAYAVDPLPNTKQNLWTAQVELDRFVSDLRIRNYKI